MGTSLLQGMTEVSLDAEDLIGLMPLLGNAVSGVSIMEAMLVLFY